MSPYQNCVLCPRRCGVNREAGECGYCGETSELRIAFAGIHRGEEPPVTGEGGSGTVFITGCSLGCVFCQNYQVSQKGFGRVVSTAEFAGICLALQEKGAENLNIVTGSHAAPALVKGIEAAKIRGLIIPVLWNSSGYDGLETLEILKDVVDVYLPDLKTLDSAIAAGFSNAPDYPEHACAAILKMMEFRELRFACKPALSEAPALPVSGPAAQPQAGDKMLSGVMIRHLILPGFLENTRQVLRWFTQNCSGASGCRALLSLMTQYTPVVPPGTNGRFSGKTIPERFLSEDEYDEVMLMLEEFGIEDGFCQEPVTGSDWLPDFTRPNPFSSKLSVPVWHCGSVYE